jgi:hypothetical protein
MAKLDCPKCKGKPREYRSAYGHLALDKAAQSYSRTTTRAAT